MQETPDTPPEPGSDPALGALKWLVVALTATMTLATIVVAAVFVLRFPATAPAFPDDLALPEGAVPAAITRGRDFIAVVTEADEILVLSPDGGTLRQRIEIAP